MNHNTLLQSQWCTTHMWNVKRGKAARANKWKIWKWKLPRLFSYFKQKQTDNWTIVNNLNEKHSSKLVDLFECHPVSTKRFWIPHTDVEVEDNGCWPGLLNFLFTLHLRCMYVVICCIKSWFLPGMRNSQFLLYSSPYV